MPIERRLVEAFIAKHPIPTIIESPATATEPEMVTAEVHRESYNGSSVAYALVSSLPSHYHHKTTMIYIMVRGVLRLYKQLLHSEVGIDSVLLSEERHYEIIRPNTVHYASCVGDPAEVIVVSIPAYDRTDCFFMDTEPSI